MIEIKNCAMTHGGKFHADDVFSAALLKLLNSKIQIIRAFKVPEEYTGIVFDIGYGEFDHHQKSSEIRKNGVPYAAFGLLWRQFGKSLIESLGCPLERAEKETLHFDEVFVQALDEDDNTGCGNSLARAIDSFNSSWDSEESSDQCFEEAVYFATVILKKQFNRMLSVHRARTLVEAALVDSQDTIVVLPRFAPWKEVLVPSDAEFVVYPSQRGGYSAQVIPSVADKNDAKCYFPEEWAGMEEAEIQKISGITTLTFCHKGRFLISADCLDDVIRACKLARDIASKASGEQACSVISEFAGKETV